MRILLRVLSVLGVLVSLAWVVFSPGFEPVLTSLGCVAAFLSSFAKASVEKNVIAHECLSGRANALLVQIDASEDSKAKGISLMMIDSVTGGYRPYLWNNHLHGAINLEIADISDVLQSVDELEDRGFLVVHHVEGSLRQWRRTAKQP
jgi:hypothetical protein